MKGDKNRYEMGNKIFLVFIFNKKINSKRERICDE